MHNPLSTSTESTVLCLCDKALQYGGSAWDFRETLEIALFIFKERGDWINFRETLPSRRREIRIFNFKEKGDWPI